jgi:hypothetical protein
MALTSLSIRNLERNGRVVQFPGSHGSPPCGLTPVDDVPCFAEPAEKVKGFHTRTGRGIAPRPDDLHSDSVHANPA